MGFPTTGSISMEQVRTELVELIDKTGIATTTKAGIIKVGSNLSISSDGTLSGNPAVDISGKLDKGNLPATIQTGERILELIENNSGLEFDENLLYIQDVGTKQANKYYFDKFQKGLFRCLSNTTSTVNSATYFENESNRNNADKLENFSKIKKLFEGAVPTDQQITLSENVSNYRFLIICADMFWGYDGTPASYIIPTEALLKYGCSLSGGNDGNDHRRIKVTAYSNILSFEGVYPSDYYKLKLYYVYGLNTI